jgi:hypothetical protein
MPLWHAYTGPNIYGCPTRWLMNKDQRKFTRLYNKIDDREGGCLLNKYCICDQIVIIENL